MSTIPPPNEQQPAVWPPTPAAPEYDAPAFENTSGSDGPLPIEIARLKWNWGAFGIAFWWLLAHKRTLAAIMLLLAGILINVLSRTVNPSFGILGLGTFAYYIFLGVNGHRIAWRSRRFDSLEQYMTVQRIWANWFAGLVIIGIVGGIIFVLAAVNHPHGAP